MIPPEIIRSIRHEQRSRRTAPQGSARSRAVAMERIVMTLVIVLFMRPTACAGHIITTGRDLADLGLTPGQAMGKAHGLTWGTCRTPLTPEGRNRLKNPWMNVPLPHSTAPRVRRGSPDCAVARVWHRHPNADLGGQGNPTSFRCKESPFGLNHKDVSLTSHGFFLHELIHPPRRQCGRCLCGWTQGEGLGWRHQVLGQRLWVKVLLFSLKVETERV